MRELFVPRGTLIVGPSMSQGGGGVVRGFNVGKESLVGSLVCKQVWTVSELATALWLDGADESTIAVSSGAVSQWADKSGNGRHATQATTGARPTKISNGVQLNGSSQWLVTPGYQSSVLHNFFIVAEIASTTATVIAERSSNINDNANTFYFGVASDSQVSIVVRHSSALYTSATHSGKNSSIGIMCSKYSGGTTNFFYRDGVEQGKTASEVSSGSGTSASVPTYIGSRGGTSRFLNAKIREIIHINSEISDEYRQKIEGYLAHKWDALLSSTMLVNNLPQSHPYKYDAPQL